MDLISNFCYLAKYSRIYDLMLDFNILKIFSNQLGNYPPYRYRQDKTRMNVFRKKILRRNI